MRSIPDEPVEERSVEVQIDMGNVGAFGDRASLEGAVLTRVAPSTGHVEPRPVGLGLVEVRHASVQFELRGIERPIEGKLRGE